MDRKSIVILVVCIIVLVLWYPLVVSRYYPQKPAAPSLSNTVNSSQGPSTNAPPVLAEAPTNAAAVPPPRSANLRTNAPEQIIELTNSLCRYTFSSLGGGLKEVELLAYKESTTTRNGAMTNRATLNSFGPVPALTILGAEAVQGDGVFELTRTPNGVRATKTLTNGLSIVKDFEPGTNYLLTASVKFINHSTNVLKLPPQEWVVGTSAPMSSREKALTVGVLWYNGVKTVDIGQQFFSKSGFMCTPRIPPPEYRDSSGNVVWVAAHNQFFTLAAMPKQPAQQVVIQPVSVVLPSPSGIPNLNAPPLEGYYAAMVYPALNLAPQQTMEREIQVFSGPKEYRTLAKLALRFNNNIDLVMGFGGFFGFFAKALLLTMNWMHRVLWFSYGWAIIAITVVIKVVFWPLTQASTRSMKRMQALQPQMKAIQEKYKDDPMKMNRKTMEFMKEHKVSPLGGCLPMLLQIPVFFGFYRMIQSAIELRGESFLWVKDLSLPDTLFFIPGTGFPFNLLPLIMGATMLWQARLTPPSPGMDPAQAKMMRYMPLIFLGILYNFSAGLTLYWTVQNLLTIAQTKLTRTLPDPATPAPVVPKKRK